MNINCAPFVTVTYHTFQLCDEKKFQPPENFTEFSCYNDGLGIIVLKFEQLNLHINIFWLLD
ncbi:hypothetical protein J1605_021019 [Eschrichtius robustus]|uniref:Uncharacterized protein n=1 Tax=Eschrichtius robustus TaxID=9764 RepID=A0AB34HJ36_ESCRO|nr:hypothetical protein J1605_021019 [Eschrichtius robustus]